MFWGTGGGGGGVGRFCCGVNLPMPVEGRGFETIGSSSKKLLLLVLGFAFSGDRGPPLTWVVGGGRAWIGGVGWAGVKLGAGARAGDGRGPAESGT